MSVARPLRRRSLPLGGTECRGPKSACADLDGTKASRVSRLAARSVAGAR